MGIKKVILAEKVTQEDIPKLKYPFLGSEKIDGIRGFVSDDYDLLTRNLNLIPNLFIREQLRLMPKGFDGELIVKGKTFNQIQSAVLSESGQPDFTYKVFDICDDPKEPYYSRMEKLAKCPSFPRVEYVFPTLIQNAEELLAFEVKCLEAGHEGIMLRKPESIYKAGRSTLKQGHLLKVKRFEDAEATILDIFEQMKNMNEATIDKLGHTKRSSHQANMLPMNTLGGFICKDIKTNVEFNVGTGRGLTIELRKAIWSERDKYIGKILKYKSQPYGAKDKPRLPVFIGFRSTLDM